jgi:hypothetical protein
MKLGPRINNYIKMYESKDNFGNDTDNENMMNDDSSCKSTKIHYCEMCKTEGQDSSFIILECGHLFHINCLANDHHNESRKRPILDDDFFSNRKCIICEVPLDSSEMMYVHSKYTKGTSSQIKSHDQQITKLERHINKLKEEMKIAIEYKQKLEFDKEKSKQIMVMLNLTF